MKIKKGWNSGTMYKASVAVTLLVIVLLSSLSGCKRLCGCTESEADAATMAIVKGLDPRVSKATLERTSHIAEDDEFTLTLEIPNQNPIVSKGTFSESGDTITFRVTNGVSALIMPGEYKITCTEREGRKVIIVQRKNPVGPPLTFVCQ
jgi:hypothetical protein